MGEGEGGDGMDVLDGGSAPEEDQAYDLLRVTIGVMFIDQTPGGVLAKKLQEVEDRLATVSGYLIRMVELSGTQLQRLLPNTNPWSGHNCGRINCYTCDQVKRSYRTVRGGTSSMRAAVSSATRRRRTRRRRIAPKT